MRPVPLFQRRPRVGCEPLCLRLGKRHHSADVVAGLPGVEPGGGDVPAQVRPEGRIAQHGGDAAQLVAVGVHLRHQHLDHALDRRRLVGRRSGRVELVEGRAPVVVEDRVDEVLGKEDRIRNTRDVVRESHRRLGRLDESAIVLRSAHPRPDALGRKRPVHHPFAQGHTQPVDQRRCRNWIRPQCAGAPVVAGTVGAGVRRILIHCAVPTAVGRARR